MKETLYILTFVLFTNCNNGTGRNTSAIDSLATTVTAPVSSESSRVEIVCDSIYKNRNYKLTLTTLNNASEDELRFNSILTIEKRINGNYLEIFRDSIFSKVQEVRFDDYNNDGLKDILVQNISDVRSNWTYYLYLVDTTSDKLEKIKGFEEIKNPRFIAKDNLIDNYVNSGRNWTQFHRIKGDSIFNYGVTIYDGENDNGNVTYDMEYKNAVKKILSGV